MEWKLFSWKIRKTRYKKSLSCKTQFCLYIPSTYTYTYINKYIHDVSYTFVLSNDNVALITAKIDVILLLH